MVVAERKETEWKYLSAISGISGVTGLASTKELSKDVGVTPASVTEMLKRLSKKGFVNYRPYRGASLTPKGREAVKCAEERRSVLQIFFSRIGLSTENSERQAREMASRISEESFLRLKELVSKIDDSLRREYDIEPVSVSENRGLAQAIQP